MYLVHLQGCVAGDSDLEQSCGDIARLLTARVLDSDDASYPTAKKEKRPPEPPIDLVLLRKYELDAMILQGKNEAYAANLTAGYFGGNGTIAATGDPLPAPTYPQPNPFTPPKKTVLISYLGKLTNYNQSKWRSVVVEVAGSRVVAP